MMISPGTLRTLSWTTLFLLIFAAGCHVEPSSRTLPESSSNSLEKVQIRVGEFIFDALAAGPSDGELVLLLHGFPQTGYSYRHQIAALAEAGYRAVAPNQRGYSPGARPEGADNYALPLIVQDTIGMVDALGRERFHLVGHDWGGAVAWLTATRFPQRVISLTVFSTPHFAALGAELAKPDSDQAQKSAYFNVFGAEGAEERFLADDGAYFRGLFQGASQPGSPSGLSPDDIQHYVEALSDPAAMRAALNWYRALIQSRSTAASTAAPASSPPPIQVPTLYVWGTQDAAFAREPAEATAQYVTGPYRFEALEGIGHWIPEQAAEIVTPMLLEHIDKVSKP